MADGTQEDFDWEDWDEKEPTRLDRVRFVIRNIVILIVLAGLLFLSGIYQGTLFHKTPPVVQEDLPNVVAYPEITIPLRIFVFESIGIRGSARTRKDVETLVANADVIWNQSAISLSVSEINYVSVTDDELKTFIEYPTPFFDTFVDGQYRGINVFLMETLRGLNGIAYRDVHTVAIADFTTVRDYRTLAHEVGHIFSLPHTRSTDDLMFSGSNGIHLSDEEMQRARGWAEGLRMTQ